MALLTIGLMYASFIGIGWLASRRTRGGGADGFMVAGRAMPIWLATATMTATWVDGGYLLGTAEGVYRSSLASGLQGGVCFGISLIIGGLFFARRMRELEYHTLIDPFEARFGARWAVVLALPAVLAEMFWSAELLVALGSTFGVVLDLDLTTGIVVSAAVVTLYTMAGGMWAVAYTDAFQLLLVIVGLAVALPYALSAAGGISHAWAVYQAAPHAPALSSVSWWDASIMLMLGGVPWNCYFQRVLSCRTPRAAQAHSILSGFATIALTIPPLLMGLVAFAYVWPPAVADRLAAQPADALPLIFKHAVPPVIGLLGLAAIVGAVTSSFSSSILSAGSMFAWNVWRRLLKPDLSVGGLAFVIRAAIATLGRWRGVDGAGGAERAGAVVLHERSGVRAAVPATRLRAVRFQGQSDGLDGGVHRVVDPAIGRGRAVIRGARPDCLPGLAAVQDGRGRDGNDPAPA